MFRGDSRQACRRLEQKTTRAITDVESEICALVPAFSRCSFKSESFDSDLEMKAKFYCLCTGCHKMRPAEGGQEIVKSGFVRQVDHCKSQTPLIAVAVEQVVVANACVEQVAGGNA